MCTVSYNVQEQHFAVHIVCYHMLMNNLVVGTQIQQSVKTNSKLAGKPIFSSNIVLYFILYVILNELIRTHTHTHGNI